jgi:hypothetical protein
LNGLTRSRQSKQRAKQKAEAQAKAEETKAAQQKQMAKQEQAQNRVARGGCLNWDINEIIHQGTAVIETYCQNSVDIKPKISAPQPIVRETTTTTNKTVQPDQQRTTNHLSKDDKFKVKCNAKEPACTWKNPNNYTKNTLPPNSTTQNFKETKQRCKYTMAFGSWLRKRSAST